MLSQLRNKPASTTFFARTLEDNCLPRKYVVDKRGANTAGIQAINKMLKGFGCLVPSEMVWREYLNTFVEHDRHFIKRRTRLMLGLKAFASA
nr:DDE-type integrase/transposase/recombinase [Ruegeria sp. R13_0]